MARKRRTQDGDAISRLADAGEDALRRLLDWPRRTAVGVKDDLGRQLDDAATKLREIDPLARRVAALEKRLDVLEKATKTTASTASTPAKPPAAPVEPAQGEHGGRLSDDSTQ
jgi:hypothetical protein